MSDDEPHKSGKELASELYSEWLAHGPKVIEQLRINRPQDYLKAIASIIQETHS
jgi:hypothetical protein